MNKNDVILVNTTDGRYVIGKVKSVDKSHVTLSDPMAISMQMNQQGQLTSSLVPYSPYSDDGEVEFNTHSFVATTKPLPELKKNYQQATSNVTLPTPQETQQILQG